MKDNTSLNKSAMTKGDWNKLKMYLGRAIAAGGAAALVNEISRDTSVKPKETARDMSNRGDAIIVNINKADFLKDVPKPETRAKSSVDSSASSAPDDKASMTPDQIAARKKDILRRNERKFNFFGKKASDEKKTESGEKSESGKKNESGVLRDASGRFASPTDPVFVENVEKDAGMTDMVIDSVKDPMMFTAGMLGSMYIAHMIAKTINQRRQELSEDQLAESRKDYVRLVQGGNEKTAQIGKAFGLAFIVPLALTALITHKIIQNRKADKKLSKERSDSYPEEPVILYETSNEKAAEISPKTAVAMVVLRRKFMEDSLSEVGTKVAGVLPYGDTEALNELVDRIRSDKYDDVFYNLVDSYYKGGKEAALPHFVKLTNGYHSDALRNENVLGELVRDKRFHRAIDDRMSDEKYADTWGKLADGVVDDEIAAQWNLEKGGWIHKLISWLMRFSGYGRNMFRDGLVSRMQNTFPAPKQIDTNKPVASSATPSAPAGVPAATTAPNNTNQNSVSAQNPVAKASVPVDKQPTVAKITPNVAASSQSPSWKNVAPRLNIG